RLIQDNYYSMQGSALKGTMVGGARDIELEAQIDSDASRQALTQLVSDAVTASPLHGLMRRHHDSLFTLSHNGREIEPARAVPLGQPALADPGDQFDSARPAGGDWSGLVRRSGMTPQTAETTSYQGSSLAEDQDRLLHVRGICTLHPDGIKEIEQRLYNPRGSIFHFLSEEAPENGGKGRAPDAASYISAGIGFCFMTQFGRYAKIVRKPLVEYRILQDTRFSLGGASGGTGEPGNTDPVETHVYLQTGDDDNFARIALDMAEQTCFLHALCKAELNVRVRVTALAVAAAV
ncbi:MAG TPA: OsmC family peroxiredoxin, partial [Afifellaceae bacterium]|nr:OsmC family peroxiredoxin [Afifellaceae bacterium]